MATASRGNPIDAGTALTRAAWQAWSGQDADYEVTRRRIVEQAEGTDQASTAERAAKAYCIRPSTNAELLAKTLHLAQRAVGLGTNDPRSFSQRENIIQPGVAPIPRGATPGLVR